jgi:cytochrome c5
MTTRIEDLAETVVRPKGRATGYGAFLLAIALVFPAAQVQSAERSGKDVVDEVCAACHAEGKDGAPRIGDSEAWSGRASQGLSSLTRHALDGIRNMPAHGGDPHLSDLEIARAVTYMVNRSGGNWIEPASDRELAAERSGEQVVSTQCAKCHAEGVGGAPRIGDLQAWVQRMQHGLPYLVSSAIRGHGGMPPRGGLANLTDAELQSAILYMYNPAGIPAKATSGAAKPAKRAADPNHQSVDDISVYVGYVPAENMRALPKDSPERAMHGGVPDGPGYYHINVSLFDETSRTPISDAKVRMEFDWPGLKSPDIELEPMMVGEGSYGKYVKPEPGATYDVTLHIKRPGATRSVTAKFKHKF